MPTRDQSLPSHVLRATSYLLNPGATNTSGTDTKRASRWETIEKYSGRPGGIALAKKECGVTKRHLYKLERDQQLKFDTSEDHLQNPQRVEQEQQAIEDGEVDSFGRMRDKERRLAVEQYAVEKASAYYSGKGYTCKTLGKPFDLLCTRGNQVLHVEVKGTTTAGAVVCLTRNEVNDARDQSWDSELFVVTHVEFRHDGLRWIAFGGRPRVVERWSPADEDLVATEYAYRVPSDLLKDIEESSVADDASSLNPQPGSDSVPHNRPLAIRTKSTELRAT